MTPEDLNRMSTRLLPHWPRILVGSGLGLFWISCAAADRLPEAALFAGPLLILVGVIMIALAKRA